VNSAARLKWTREAAEYMRPRYRSGSGIMTSASDLRAIFREAGIPFREISTEDSGMLWLARVKRPCLAEWPQNPPPPPSLWRQEWAVTYQGDMVEQAIQANRSCLQYRLEKEIDVKDAAPVRIYRR
jgi:hypothetical protein